MIKIAGIVRKSPTNKEDKIKDNIQDQIDGIESFCEFRHKNTPYEIIWFIDENVSGDADLDERPALKSHFEQIKDFDEAVAHRTDRFSRSYLGVKWFYEYYSTDNGRSKHSGCKLLFVTEVPEMYDKKSFVDVTNFFVFSQFCMLAQYDLMKIRTNTDRGRARLKAKLTPEEWRKKYPGRKLGSTNKKKKKR